MTSDPGPFPRSPGGDPGPVLALDIGGTNDYSYEDVFRRQVEALVRPGDVVVAFTTSGRSPNVIAALAAAQAKGATTPLFAGGDAGPARDHADRTLLVPSTSTQRIQEMHTLMLHVTSEMVDAWAAGEEPAA